MIHISPMRLQNMARIELAKQEGMILDDEMNFEGKIPIEGNSSGRGSRTSHPKHTSSRENLAHTLTDNSID